MQKCRPVAVELCGCFLGWVARLVIRSRNRDRRDHCGASWCCLPLRFLLRFGTRFRVKVWSGFLIIVLHGALYIQTCLYCSFGKNCFHCCLSSNCSWVDILHQSDIPSYCAAQTIDYTKINHTRSPNFQDLYNLDL